MAFNPNYFLYPNQFFYTTPLAPPNQFSAQHVKNKSENDCSTREKTPSGSFPAYRIIEFFTVFTTLSSMLTCKNCNSDIKFEEKEHSGLGFYIVVKCCCGQKQVPSGPKVPGDFEINRRMVFAMRMCGQGLNALNLFCNLMDLGRGLSKKAYGTICALINNSASKVFKISSQRAAESEKEEMVKLERSTLNLKVSGYGQTWNQRGLETLFGVMPLTAYYSGKVIDLEVKTCFCDECLTLKNQKEEEEEEKWCLKHHEKCRKSQEVTTEIMEVEATKKMFLRSIGNFNVKYREYDGNSGTYNKILQSKPYGERFPVKKFENSVYKRKTYECLHATIWRLAAKNCYDGKESVESAANIAAAIFNDGFVVLADLMSDLDINVSLQMRQYVESVDAAKRQKIPESSSLLLKEEDEVKRACKRADGLLYTLEFAD